MRSVLSFILRYFGRRQRHVGGFVFAQFALAIVIMSYVGNIVYRGDTHIFFFRFRHGEHPVLLTHAESLSFHAAERQDGIQAAEGK